MPASVEYVFACVTCGRRFSAGEAPLYVCPACAAKQSPGAPLQGTLEVLYDYAAWAATHARDDAHQCVLLPELPPAPLEVGPTPVYDSQRLAAAAGVAQVLLKDDTVLPTGSLKDRASALVVRMARALGQGILTCASTGNAASSLAGFCAAASLPCVLFVSARAPRAKLVQLAAYGATLLRIDGSYDDCFELSLQATQSFAWYNRNTAFNPWTTEGKKSVAWELAWQSGFDLPDQVFVPTGDGSILSGVYKGFFDLRELGWIERMPRLVAVQPRGSSALANAWEQQDDGSTARLDHAHSVADSLVVDAPRNAVRALRDVRASDGYCLAVEEHDILAATATVAAHTGVFVEPAAAAGWAGLLAARAAGRVAANDRVALLLTGSGLKDVAAVEKAVALPAPVEPEWQPVCNVIAMDDVLNQSTR